MNNTLEMSKFVIPMRLSRFTAQHDIKQVFPCGFWCENKFDGWRLQLHKNGNDIRLYSRTGKGYSDSFRSLIDTILRDGLLNVDQCIVDGEILSWDTVHQTYGLCSSLMTVANACKIGARDKILVIRLFDVMQIDGENVMGLQLKIRRERLRMIVKTNSDVVQVVEPLKLDGVDVLNTWNQVKLLLKIAMSNGEEGLVLKDFESIYNPGIRSVGLFKIKPDYFDHGTVEYDLLIVGARCRVDGSPYHFLVALADPPASDSKHLLRFLTVSHFGGMTVVEKKALGSVLHGTRVNFKKDVDMKTLNTDAVTFKRYNSEIRPYVTATWVATKEQPAVTVIFSGKRDEFCEVVFDPRDSIIVTLKADFRLTPTVTFATNHTLRFPRLHPAKRIRLDRSEIDIHGDPKAFSDCMCISEFEDIVKSSIDGSIATKANFDFIPNKRKCLSEKPKIVTDRQYNGNGVPRYSMLLNYVIHVQKCQPETLKSLEMIATELGATVYSCDPNSGKKPMVFSSDKKVIVIGTNTTSQAFVRCKCADRDVVSDTWLRKCHSLHADDPSAKPPELQPMYMLYTSTGTKEEFVGKSMGDEVGNVE